MPFGSPVPIGGYISGGGGTIAVLGGSVVEITANADLTLSLLQADPLYLQVTSDGESTSIRKVKIPLIAGKTWIVENAVSDEQAIEVCGPTGTEQGVFILPGAGACAYCVTDGSVVFSPSQDAQYPVTVTYQPGSVASGTVFTSWAALIAYVTAIIDVVGFAGTLTIRFDDGFADVVIPASAIPGANILLVGVNASPGVPIGVTLDAGVTFPGITAAGTNEAYLSLTNLFVGDHGTAPMATVGSGGVFLLTMTGSQWSQQVTTALSGGVFLAVDGGGIGINGTQAVLQEGGPPLNHRALVLLDTGEGSFSVHNFNSTVIGGYALQGGDAGSINVTMTNNSSIVTHADAAAFNLSSISSDSVIGASLIPQIGEDALIDLATLVAYAPASGSNWETAFGVVPTTVGQALDLIAAKLA